MTKAIDELYAFIVLDRADDTEGIPLWEPAPGTYTPIIAADMERVTSLREVAEQVATEQQQPVHLVRFSQREVLETIEPGPRPEPTTVENGPPSSTAAGPEPVVDPSAVILTDTDIDVYDGGVVVFCAMLGDKPTVCFQFYRGDGEGPDVMKPIGLQEEPSRDVGPLAMAAYTSGQRALRQQQN